MKKLTYFLVYLATLAIGVLLLAFNRDALSAEVPETLRGLVIAGGILFLVGGAVGMIASFKPKRDAEGVLENRPWYLTVMWIGSIFWGVLTLVFSPLFTAQMAATLGVDLIIAAFAQTMWIAEAAKPYGAVGWWYTIPFCVLGAGIVDITLINDYANIAQSSSTACIVSGILLLAYGANGILSINRRKRIEKKMIESVNEIAKENREEKK